jgi:hypothetical protein
MSKVVFTVFLTCALHSYSSYGQVEARQSNVFSTTDSLSPKSQQGTIIWNMPTGLSNLLEAYKRENFKEQGIDGYRIQLFSDGGNNAKDRAQSMLDELQRNYPDYSSYLTYQQPNFKVRIGNFRTKAEAREFQTLLSQNYPGCFIVKDLIKVN